MCFSIRFAVSRSAKENHSTEGKQIGQSGFDGGQKRDPAETEELLVAQNLLLVEEVLHHLRCIDLLKIGYPWMF